MSEHIVTAAPDPDEKFPPKEAGIFIGGAIKPIRYHTLAVWRLRRIRWEREQERLRSQKGARETMDTKPPGRIGPKFVKIASAVRYRRADLEEFLASCRSGSPKPQPPKRKYTRRKR